MLNIGFNHVVAAGRNSGAKEYLVNLLSELIALEGPERYTVYVAREESPDVVDRISAASGRVQCVRTPIPMFPTSVRVLRGETYWRNQLAKDGVDVFHHTYFPLPRGVEKVSGVVLTLHDLIQRGMPEAFTRPRRLFTNAVQPGAFRRADKIVVVSDHVRGDVARFHPEVNPDKVAVVPNAVGGAYLARGGTKVDPGVRESVRARYGLPERYILGVGHLEPRKNWPRVIEAYARLRRESGEDIPELVIVGAENWKFSDIYEIAEREGVRERISFTGFVREEDIAEVYANATVFVYPSLYEGFGIPVLEAMACGVPVVTSDVTSLPEVSGGAACLVDPYSIESIASGMSRVLRDERYREELIDRGYRNVQRYRWEDSARRLREIYREVGAARQGSIAKAARS